MMQHPSSNNSLEFLVVREMESGKGRRADPRGPGKRGLRLEWAKGAGPGPTPQYRVQWRNVVWGHPAPSPRQHASMSVTDTTANTHRPVSCTLSHSHTLPLLLFRLPCLLLGYLSSSGVPGLGPRVTWPDRRFPYREHLRDSAGYPQSSSIAPVHQGPDAPALPTSLAEHRQGDRDEIESQTTPPFILSGPGGGPQRRQVLRRLV